MHTNYLDIRGRLGKPTWWDEYAVPRYCEFTTDRIANTGARQCALVEIACQSCGHKYQVAVSSRVTDPYPLSTLIEQRWMNYGDPPNYCCFMGASVNSIPLRVLEFWIIHSATGMGWERFEKYESADIVPDWAKDIVEEMHLLDKGAP